MPLFRSHCDMITFPRTVHIFTGEGHTNESDINACWIYSHSLSHSVSDSLASSRIIRSSGERRVYKRSSLSDSSELESLQSHNYRGWSSCMEKRLIDNVNSIVHVSLFHTRYNVRFELEVLEFKNCRRSGVFCVVSGRIENVCLI